MLFFLYSQMEKRLEKRLSQVYTKMKKERDTNTVSTEIKSMLDEFRMASKEDLTTRQLNASEAEKQKVFYCFIFFLQKLHFSIFTLTQKTLNELILTKKRLVDLEDSKSHLSSQVQSLKDQLQKFKQEQKFQQMQRTKEDTSTCKCNIEIQNLKAEVSRSKSSDS